MIGDMEVKITVNYRSNFLMNYGGVSKNIKFYFPFEMNYHLSALHMKRREIHE